MNTFRVQPKEIHIPSHHNPSRIGGPGEVLSIFSSHETSIARGGHVNASIAECICQSRWDVFVQMKSDDHRSGSLFQRLPAQLGV